jgi:perosamine synthetase
MNHPRIIPVAEPDLGPAEEQAVLDALRSGWVSSLGAHINRFEETFALFCNACHAATVSNGTVAIHLLLVAAGIGPGDEVIVPSLTFVATAAAVIHAGAVPVIVDCEPLIGTMDPAAVAAAVSPRVKAILAVHLYGHPAEMDALREVADRHGLFLFEDAAEAHGALYRGKVVGGLGHASTFSFYGNKVMTTGEGGMIVTNDVALDDRIRFLRDHAMDRDRRYWHSEVGFNYRMTNLQAALGTAQLGRISEITARRQAVLDHYRNAGLERFGLLINPKADWATPVPWLVCAVFPQELAPRVEEIRAGLRRDGVDTRPYFIPIEQMPPYSGYRRVAADGGDRLAGSATLAARGINLPSSGSLSEGDVAAVCALLAKAIG